jgi:hypothetical protein
MHIDETYLIDGIVAECPVEITDDETREMLGKVPQALFEPWNAAKTHEQSVRAADAIIAAALEAR